MVDKATPIWQLTVGEFMEMQEQVTKPQTVITPTEKRYVYGITGIAELFSCSKTTANSIKQSGKIDKAIIQIGRKIAVDAELAMSLVSKKR